MNEYLKEYGINQEVWNLINDSEKELTAIFKKIDDLAFLNSLNVIRAFKKANVTEACFATSTGYGYNDLGRDTIEKVFKIVLKAEDALVRGQFISGSHALTVALFAFLRPNDTMMSITGEPYDTLHEVIGIKENNSSLKAFGVKYEQVDLKDNDFDYEKIREILTKKKIKLIEIQRSRGYSTRQSLTIDKLEKVIKFIRTIDKEVIIMVDNCYCEFVEDKNPLEVGASVIVGSLIKNLGGGIAPNGAYIAGKKELIELASERLNLPGEGREVGPSLNINKEILLGLYEAPSVVASALKCAILTSHVLEKLGYEVDPKFNEKRADIVETIKFGNPDDLVKYCGGIQAASAIDANALVVPTDMPGYSDQVVMASGSFVQGSSIEISCDGPMRSPYIAYQQGSLTYPYGKIAVMVAVSKILQK